MKPRLSPAWRFQTLVLCLALLTSCAREAVRPRNLLLLTVDTLRADHLACYGYGRPTSPNLDQLAAQAVLFERAYSVASWTLPSVVSLLTSLYPSAHDCQGDRSALSDAHTTLAEHLAKHGYHTGAVTSHVYLSSQYGLEQGFADFDEEFVHANRKQSHAAVSSPAISDRALAWLEQRARDEAPWFLWLHYFDPHSEYQEHPPAAPRMGPGNQGLYDAEIAFTDAHIGRVLERLEQLGLGEETLVIFSADHGEEFGDHGGAGHRATLYEEVLRVPLLIAHPTLRPSRIAQPVSCIDLFPTICELLDLPAPSTIQGQSLAPLLRGEALEPRALLAEMRNRNQLDWDALIVGNYKLIYDVTGERKLLYDLALDPKEKRDLAAEQPEMVAQLWSQLQAQIAAARTIGAALGEAQPVELTPEDESRLEQLGYGGEH